MEYNSFFILFNASVLFLITSPIAIYFANEAKLLKKPTAIIINLLICFIFSVVISSAFNFIPGGFIK